MDASGKRLAIYTHCQCGCEIIKEVTITQGNQKQGYNKNCGCRGATTKGAEGK